MKIFAIGTREKIPKELAPFIIKKSKENVVYCSGKSGSKTLSESLKNSAHFHSLINYAEQRKLSLPRDCKFNMWDILDENVERHRTPRVYVYDAYRTLFERKISSFFQLLEDLVTNDRLTGGLNTFLSNNVYKYPYLYSFDTKAINERNFIEHSSNHIENLIEIFWWTALISRENYYGHLEYRQLKEFKIHNLPYYTQNYGKYTYVILKFELIADWEKQLSKILNRPIKLKKSNMTNSNKGEINILYEEFKKKVTIPSVLFNLIFYKDLKRSGSLVTGVCNHYKIMQKFYDDEFIHAYTDKWKKKLNNEIPDKLYDPKLPSADIIEKVHLYFCKNPR